MEFAIVRFTAEDDAPGIVAKNWINQDGNSCLYPNVRTEERKNKLLLARETPGKDWLQCPIKILKEFSTYKAARSKLTEAENTSNIDSADEISKPRRRKKRQIHLPGEASDSEDESFNNKRMDCHRNQTLCIEETSAFAFPPPPVPCLDDSMGGESVSLINPPIQKSDLSNKGSIDAIEKMKINQATMWSAITELMNIAQQNSKKLDEILNKIDKLTVNSKEPEKDIELISLLPVGMEDFENLNKKILESSSLRKNLVNILMTSGGRDAKGMMASMLRKLITDDVAECYSLTGRTQKDGPLKQSFEKTAIYKLIIHACTRVYPLTNENVMREGISEWLMQAKFRKSRREKKNRPEEDSIDFSF